MSCLNVKATLLNLPVVVGISLLSGIECSASVLNPPLNVSVMDVTPKLKVSGHLVCSVGGGSYLRVAPDVVWLTPDMIGGEFDIYSNVAWKIDIEPSEDDRDIVSMLFNQTMIGNDTLFLNGDDPSQVLETLHNGQMITNETLLVDTSVIIIKELESSTRMLNKYYLKN